MDKKQETYLIPEKGPEGSLTGRTIVYKPGEWSERYNLLKAAAEDDPGHKRNFVDIELKDLKRDQALWSEEKKGYFDARGKKYNYSQMVKQNQYVKAKANTITDDANLIINLFIAKVMIGLVNGSKITRKSMVNLTLLKMMIWLLKKSLESKKLLKSLSILMKKK